MAKNMCASIYSWKNILNKIFGRQTSYPVTFDNIYALRTWSRQGSKHASLVFITQH